MAAQVNVFWQSKSGAKYSQCFETISDAYKTVHDFFYSRDIIGLVVSMNGAIYHEILVSDFLTNFEAFR